LGAEAAGSGTTRESGRETFALLPSIFGGNTMQETNLLEQGQTVKAITNQIPTLARAMTLCSYGTKLAREELAQVKTPAGTATHKPIPHIYGITVVEKLIEALSFRQIGVVREEYAVLPDGMKMFGVMDLSSGFDGCRFRTWLEEQPR
jgi:hypothetical protein